MNLEMNRDGVGNSVTPPSEAEKQGVQLLKYDFVWNNYPKDQLEQIEQFLCSFTKKAVFQEEDEGTPHLQGAIWLKKRARKTELHKEVLMAHMSFRKCKSWVHLVNYCTDPLKRIDGGRVFYHGVKARPKPVLTLDDDKLYSWQYDIISFITKKPDDRIIYWYYDYKGNSGKSTFCKYLCIKHNALVISGKSKDMFHGIAKYKDEKGDYPDCIILDVPRCGKRFLSYGGIEAVKNGLFFSGKYESSMHVFNIPHVIVFSNFQPDYQNMSLDRWNVTNLREDELSEESDTSTH